MSDVTIHSLTGETVDQSNKQNAWHAAIALSVAGVLLIAGTIYQSYFMKNFTDSMGSYYVFHKQTHVLGMWLAGIYKMVAPVLLLICAVPLTLSPVTLKLKPHLFKTKATRSLLVVILIKVISMTWLVYFYKPTIEWVTVYNQKRNIAPEVLNAYATKLLAQLFIVELCIALVAVALLVFLWKQLSRPHEAGIPPLTTVC
jgi:lysylphosphatidylglycerol synthetase-like protein (DUF2156 family)